MNDLKIRVGYNKTLRTWEITGRSIIDRRSKVWRRTTVLTEFTKASARHLCERQGYEFLNLREI